VLSFVVELLEPIPTLHSVDVEIDELAARRSLRDQIARLERDLGVAFAASFPTGGLDTTVTSRGGPRLL